MQYPRRPIRTATRDPRSVRSLCPRCRRNRIGGADPPPKAKIQLSEGLKARRPQSGCPRYRRAVPKVGLLAFA